MSDEKKSSSEKLLAGMFGFCFLWFVAGAAGVACILTVRFWMWCWALTEF